MSAPPPFSPDKPFCDHRFDSPWAARLFGVTIALSERGVFSLGDFQAALTAAIAAQEQAAPITDEAGYYSCWLEALSALANKAGLLEDEALSRSERAVAARLRALRHDHGHAAHGPRRIAPLVVA